MHSTHTPIASKKCCITSRIRSVGWRSHNRKHAGAAAVRRTSASDAATTAAAAVNATAPTAAANDDDPVRLIAPADEPETVARVLDALGAAFRDDPLLPLLGVPPARRARFFRLWGVFLQKLERERVLYVCGGGDAFAIVAYGHQAARLLTWLDAWRAGAVSELLALSPRAWRPFLDVAQSLTTSGELLRPLGVTDPYLKLIALGVHPDRAAGRGLGRRVMAAVAARAEREGVDLFLEAAPNGVDRWYAEKFGFETVGEVRCDTLPHGCLWVPLMLKRARRRGGGGDGGSSNGVSSSGSSSGGETGKQIDIGKRDT